MLATGAAPKVNAGLAAYNRDTVDELERETPNESDVRRAGRAMLLGLVLGLVLALVARARSGRERD